MKRLSALLTLVLCLSASSFARQKVQGYCEQGGKTVTTSGLTSTTKVQQSFPSCTITIYLASTVTPATVYGDNAGTPKSNPLTADSTGYWFAYADNGRYDVRQSGGGIASPFTLGDYLLDDNAEMTLTLNAMAFNATPTFDASLYSSFSMTLTGNITSSVVTNAKAGRIIALSLCQDGTGTRTVSWPPTFDSAPVPDARASKCLSTTWFYNGSRWKMIGQGGDSLGLPASSVITNGSAVLTLPTTTDTLVGRATTDTLTNKTLSGATFSGAITSSATITGGTLASNTITTPTLSGGTIAGSTLSGTLAGTPTFSGQVIFSAAIPFTVSNTGAVANLTLLADTQLPTISTAGKVSDSALSSNVALYNNGSKTWGAGAATIWTFNTGSGAISLTAKTATSTNGPFFTINGGSSSFASGNGGDVTLNGGSGGATSGSGGSINLTPGTGQGSGLAGDFVYTPGSGTGTGRFVLKGSTLAPTGGFSNAAALYYNQNTGKLQLSENASSFGNINAPAIINGACTGTATSSVTRGMYLLGQTTSIACTNAYTNTAAPVSPRAGNVQNLRVKCGTGGFNASSGAFTVMIDGVASSVVATVGTGTTASDITHQAAITAGQTYSVQFTTQATETLANCSASFEIQ